ncbi:hypothetical protein [Janthinobacterium sp. TND4EL3]|uniref:hypothetical protein n=1 Tax=Janthinobacterium sp. TND4EL3 TaxID=1907311 RepID=UPI00148364B1|nr:hypothetical protein [Janthinobacterium sp. TND4EL3]
MPDRLAQVGFRVVFHFRQRIAGICFRLPQLLAHADVPHAVAGCEQLDLDVGRRIRRQGMQALALRQIGRHQLHFHRILPKIALLAAHRQGMVLAVEHIDGEVLDTA